MPSRAANGARVGDVDVGVVEAVHYGQVIAAEVDDDDGVAPERSKEFAPAQARPVAHPQAMAAQHPNHLVYGGARFRVGTELALEE